MSKANRAFVRNEEAVSPVIGVILMVAITVVLAAVVFVLVSNLGQGSEAPEAAAITATSPSTGVIEITLTRGGENAPYQFHTSTNPNYATITINGVACVIDTDGTMAGQQGAHAGVTAPDSWAAGGVVRLSNPTGAVTTGCVAEVVAGTSVSASVAVAGTLIASQTVSVDA